MKYTRYNLKRKNKTGITFTAVAFSILTFSILIGIFMLKGCTGSANAGSKNLLPIKNQRENIENGNKKISRYIAIQGGLYKVKEYADETKKILSDYGSPFIITEGDKTMRVLLGVYGEAEATKLMKSLSDKGIENSKMIFEIPQADLCDVEITEIINANLQILTTVSGKGVSSVQTEDFKKWCLALKDVDVSSKNITLLKDLKNNANSLPKEISKDKVSDLYMYIYNKLQKFIVKRTPNT